MQTDYDYYLSCKAKVSILKRDWELKNISNEVALQCAKDWKQAMTYFVVNESPTPTRANIEKLLVELNKLIDKIQEDMKTIYIVQPDEHEIIVCSNENLVKKCLERLGTNVSSEPIKTKICQSEEDLDEILPKKEEPSLKGDFVYFEFHGV